MGTSGDAGPWRLVLFDLDDTLCDYAAARALRLRLAFSLDLEAATLAVGGASVTRDFDRMIEESIAIHPHGADHFPELFRRHGIADESSAQRAMAWYRENRFHGLALFADTLGTISAMRSSTGRGGHRRRRRVGLVTNGPAETQRAKIALLGLDRLIDFAVISGEFGVEKPDPAIFREALRLGGAAAAEAVFVGDSPELDIAGAKAVGMSTVWVNRTGSAWALGDPGPDHEVKSLTAVRRLFDDAVDVDEAVRREPAGSAGGRGRR